MSTIVERGQVGLPTSWLGVVSLAIGSFALVTSEFLPVGLLPDIASSLEITTGQAGLLVTMPGLVAAVAAPFTIAFAGGIDRKKLLVSLLVLLVASNIMAAVATGLPQLLIGRFMLGLAVGSFWTIAGSLGPRLRPGAEGVRANALILSGISFGTVAGVPAGALIGDMFDWRASFWAGAALSVVSVLFVAALLPMLPSANRRGIAGLPKVLARPKARIGLLAVLAIFLAQFAAYTYVAAFLNERSGISGPLLTTVLLANGVAGFFGNMLGGWVAGKQVNAAVISASLLIGGSALILLVVGSNQFAAVTLVIVWGLGFGMLPIGMQSFLQSAAKDALEDMQALFVTVGQIAIGTGALIGGSIVDYAGLSGAMVFSGIASAITILLMLHPAAYSKRA
ncbi:MFS transporter [Pararhizobium sp. PWRC1-1]|uniref:MFS transporter n=1 Tax=Pararhizobium sp. PWRC1-1 TaxID=2804566 RepID=UPI003CEC04FC